MHPRVSVVDDQLPKRSIELVLASHTNVGKTTLARTLLGRDVGDVRDEAHVTEFSDRYTWQDTPHGESLKLWDTPGFGDSQRLLKRLQHSGTLRGWLLTEVWDRWLFPGFHFSQKVLRTVQDEADVVLYLVNAAEPPDVAGYLESEMQLLERTAKPVIVLINQLGTGQAIAQESADVETWQRHCERYPHVKRVLPLDAFTRCWVQEFVLQEAIRDVLPDADCRALMARLIAAWRGDRLQVFDQSMQVLSAIIARCAVARQPVAEGGRVRAAVDNLMRRVNAPEARKAAESALSQQLKADMQQAFSQLTRLHRVDATVEDDIGAALHQIYHPKQGLPERMVTVVSTVASGMLGGLLADLMTGGLTLGGGMLVGGLAGALGGKTAAYGYNRVYGTAQSWVEWDAQSLNQMFANAVMCYLIVAHAGRGRGKAVLTREHPRWLEVVPGAVAAQQGVLLELWGSRGTGTLDPDAERRMDEQLAPLFAGVTWSVLETLYPDAGKLRQPLQAGTPGASG